MHSWFLMSTQRNKYINIDVCMGLGENTYIYFPALSAERIKKQLMSSSRSWFSSKRGQGSLEQWLIPRQGRENTN